MVSVSRVLFPVWVTPHGAVIIPLGEPLPTPSSGQPGSFGRAALERSSIRPCTSWGLPGRPRHRGRRCALTAPFQPHRRPKAPRTRRGRASQSGDGTDKGPEVDKPPGGLLSVALSSGLPRPGVTRQLALWSSDFPRAARCRPRSPGVHRRRPPMLRPRSDQAVSSRSGSRKRPQFLQVCTREWPSISLTTWLGAP